VPIANSSTAIEEEPTAVGAPGRSVAGLQPRVTTWAKRLLPPALFLIASIALAWPAVSHLGSRVPGGADGILFAWHFEWIAQSVTHFQNPLGSPMLNAPQGMNEMWNAAVLLLSIICIPLTLTIGPFATVSLLTVIAPAISASVAYEVLRRLTGQPYGAFIGGVMYAYGPFGIGQFVHLHVLLAPFPPLLLLLGYRLLVTQSGSPVRLGTWLGVITGLQLLLAEEIVALCILGAAAGVFWLAVLNRRQIRSHARYALIGAGVAAGVSLLIAGIPLAYQFFGPNAVRTLTLSGLRADLASFVRPGQLSQFSSRADIKANLTFPANTSENTGYLGWPLIIALLLVSGWFILRQERFGSWWLLTTLSLVVLMLGSPISFNGKAVSRGPWAVVRRLPLFGGAIPVRLSLLVALMVALLIAVTLAKLRKRQLLVGVLVTALVLVPLCPYGRLRSTPLPATPAFFTTSAVNMIPKDALTVILPQATFPRVSAMLWQTRAHHRFRLVGGYSVFATEKKTATYFPKLPLFELLLNNVARTKQLTAADIERGEASIASSGVRYIIIAPEQRNADAVAAAAAAMADCSLQRVAGVTVCAVGVR